MKLTGILILTVVVASCAATSYAQSHNYFWGYISPSDKMIFQRVIDKERKLLRVVTEDVDYPPQGHVGQYIITGIRVTDQFKNGKGGYASILSGGPTYSNVKIHFKSQRGKPMKFHLEVFGK